MEIVVRAGLVFGFLWLVTRVTGRSTLGELSTFQLLLYVVMGDLVQQAVTQQDYSLTSAVLTIGTFMLLTIAVTWVNTHWRQGRKVTHGVPVIIVENGEPDVERMRSERLSLDDLMSAARQEGYRRFGDIDLAVMETNGRISFFSRAGSGDPDGSPEAPPPGG
jgi:uncharacterized membrane protein YcaP (DUF421 family)